MFLDKKPIFGRGRILKLEMLEQLRDFPRELLNVYLNGYANGILSGCKILINEDYIIITPGIIYFQEVIYVLKENSKIPYQYTNEKAILKVKFLGENINKDFISHGTQIFIDQDTQIYQDEMELCRFKLKKGANLRNDYVNLEDMITEYNTVNIIHAPFASYENSTISPDLLACFSKEMMGYKLNNPLDIAFAMQGLQNEQNISRTLITHYISARLEIDNEDFDNEQIYKHLVTILQEIKDSKDGRENRNYLESKILMD